MRFPLAPGLLVGLLAAATAGADVLLEAHEIPGWEVTAEASVTGAMDPDLREWGVREKRVRHYSRDHRGRIQVCSVELWEFESEGQATAAAAGFSYPGWRIDAIGRDLVMVHGLVRVGIRPGGKGIAQRGVFQECERIGARVRDRASSRSERTSEVGSGG